MSFPTTVTAHTEIELVNVVLEACGVPPVDQYPVDPDADANIAARYLRNTIKQEAAKGWYCFNRFDNQAITADENGVFQFPPSVGQVYFPAQQARTYATLRYNPSTQRLYNPITGLDTFPDLANTTLTVVMITNPTNIGLLPMQFQAWVAFLTAVKFGPSVGMEVDTSLADTLLRSLLEYELEHTPRSNIFNKQENRDTWER